jgi:hypothetical protein
MWTVRGPLGQLEVELHPDSVDAAAREASLRELRQLVTSFKYRDPVARRLVLAMLARLQGVGNATLSSSTYASDPGPQQAEAIGEELLFAARAGRLVVRRKEDRVVTMPVDAPTEAVLGPDSSQESAPSSKTWIGLLLLDQDGTPVPNRPYRVIPPGGTAIDGTLDSNATAIIQGLDPGNCQVWCPYVEPHPPLSYTVQQGDHLSGVAEAEGFDDYTVVWNDPGNADLQQQRTDPHVLVPGDALTIPEVKATPTADKPTGAKHTFTITRTPLKVRLKVLDRAAKPLKNAGVTVNGAALTTDGTGLVETAIDKSATGATLQAPDTTFTLDVGSINPADDTSDAGYRARLFNLGFLWDPTATDTSDEMTIALQDFQAEYSLTISGELDDATKAQLSQTYGS